MWEQQQQPSPQHSPYPASGPRLRTHSRLPGLSVPSRVSYQRSLVPHVDSVQRDLSEWGRQVGGGAQAAGQAGVWGRASSGAGRWVGARVLAVVPLAAPCTPPPVALQAEAAQADEAALQSRDVDGEEGRGGGEGEGEGGGGGSAATPRGPQAGAGPRRAFSHAPAPTAPKVRGAAFTRTRISTCMCMHSQAPPPHPCPMPQGALARLPSPPTHPEPGPTAFDGRVRRVGARAAARVWLRAGGLATAAFSAYLFASAQTNRVYSDVWIRWGACRSPAQVMQPWRCVRSPPAQRAAPPPAWPQVVGGRRL